MLDVRLYKKDADYKHQLCLGSDDGAQCIIGEEYALYIRTTEINRAVNYCTSIRVKTITERDNLHSLVYTYNDFGFPYTSKDRLQLVQIVPTDISLVRDDLNACNTMKQFEDWK